MCSLSTLIEKASIAFDTATTLTAMATVVAPPAPEDQSARAPLDLVAVVDRSGSM